MWLHITGEEGHIAGKKIVVLEDNPGIDEAKFREIAQKADVHEKLPAGCHAHLAGLGPDGHLRVVSVWDDLEAADRFHEQVLHEHRSEHLDDDVIREVWELENLVVTDDPDHRTVTAGALVIMEDNPGATAEFYHEHAGDIGVATELPAGCHVHIVGVGTEGHLRVIDIWDDLAALDAFLAEHVHPRRVADDDIAHDDIVRTSWTLENLVVTDDEEHVTART